MITMKKGLLFIGFILLALAPLGHNASASETVLTPMQDTIKVVVISQLEKHIVEIIGDDKISVTAILGPMEAPYGYIPTIEETKAVTEADILFSVDLEYLLTQSYTFTPWLPGLLSAAGNTDLIQIDLNRNITMREDPVLGSINHHTWMDPRNIRTMVEDITDELSQLDPESEAIFTANLLTYQNQLDQLVANITALTAPYKGTKVVTVSSQSWLLLDLIGFEKAGQLVKISSAQVTSKDIEDLISLIEDKNISILVNDWPGPEPEGVSTIKEDTSAKEVIFYSDTILGMTYLEIIQKNVEDLIKALEEPPKENNSNDEIPGFEWNLTILGVFFYALIGIFYVQRKRSTKI